MLEYLGEKTKANEEDASLVIAQLIETLCYLHILGDPGAVSRRRAKWRDESFQERAEEPLGTKSHRTISKRLREYRLLIGQNNTRDFFLPNQEPVFAKPFGNGPVRLGTQGFFRPFLKTFVAPFRPPPTDCPWVSEDATYTGRTSYILISG